MTPKHHTESCTACQQIDIYKCMCTSSVGADDECMKWQGRKPEQFSEEDEDPQHKEVGSKILPKGNCIATGHRLSAAKNQEK